jgi:hypothetical protein
LIPQKRNRILNDTPGPLQLMHRASEYRKKFDFKGTIQTIMIYHGWFPELDIFDDLYAKLIKSNDTCVHYDSIQSNSPLILMNGFSWELILSSIEQKFKNESAGRIITLNCIVDFIRKDANLPSKTSTNIEKYINLHNLRFSLYPLFSQKIEERANATREKLKK